MPDTPATVTVTLGSTPYVLVPTVDRMRVLNRLAGGLAPLFRAVSNLEGDGMALIIAAGSGTRGEAVEDLTRAVWESGLEDLADPLVRFLGLCVNGGRDPAAVRPAVVTVTGVAGAARGEADDVEADPAGARLVDAVQDAEKRYGTGAGCDPDPVGGGPIVPASGTTH